MKTSLAILTILSLQFAVAKLCLCSGMHQGRDSDALTESLSCCDAAEHPAGEKSRESCPHCDETKTMDLDLPVKGISAPELSALALLAPEPVRGNAVPSAAVLCNAGHFRLPPRESANRRFVPALFGVFLI